MGPRGLGFSRRRRALRLCCGRRDAAVIATSELLSGGELRLWAALGASTDDDERSSRGVEGYTTRVIDRGKVLSCAHGNS